MKKYLYFILLIALSLLVCIATFVLLSGSEITKVAVNFAFSFPACLLLCIVYYKMITRLSQVPFLKSRDFIRVDIDWLCATAIATAASTVFRLLIGTDDSWTVNFLTVILWNSVVVLGIELYVYHLSVLEKEKALMLAEKEKAAYQFEVLKQQMNPHFLFNSLNALASLAYQDAEKANLFAKKLSSVYRYLLLTADKQLVTLREEVAFLNSYLYLEQIRFGSAIDVSIDIPDALMPYKIVPVSLQLVVENAIKHNIATEEQPLIVEIVAHEGFLTIENRLQPRSEVATNGKGLSNLQRQYAAYNKSIDIVKTAKTFAVTIPLLRELTTKQPSSCS